MSGFYWIASYPKSGNTWIRLALSVLVRRNAGKSDDVGWGFSPNACQRVDFDETLDVESSDLTLQEVESLRPHVHRLMAAAAPSPLFRKVHDAWTLTATGEPLFPTDVTLGTIHIVRDPRDVAVSLADFWAMGIDEAIDFMADASKSLAASPNQASHLLQQRLLGWSGHTRSWLEAPGRAPCLVRYEEMERDPATTLACVAAYAGLPSEPEAIASMVTATRFEKLREQEKERGFNGGQRAGRRFFRSGRSGSWRDSLTAAQAARIEHDHAEMMERLGYSPAAERTHDA